MRWVSGSNLVYCDKINGCPLLLQKDIVIVPLNMPRLPFSDSHVLIIRDFRIGYIMSILYIMFIY